MKVLVFQTVSFYLFHFSGPGKSGGFAIFLALFPYFVLISLFIFCCFLDGAWKGFLEFVQPKDILDELAKPKTWMAALSQSLFSNSIGKEERNGGTVDQPTKIKTTNLVGPFGLSASS